MRVSTNGQFPSPSGVGHYSLHHPAIFSDVQSHIVCTYLPSINQSMMLWLCPTSGWDSDAQPQPCLHVFAIRVVVAVYGLARIQTLLCDFVCSCVSSPLNSLYVAFFSQSHAILANPKLSRLKFDVKIYDYASVFLLEQK